MLQRHPCRSQHDLITKEEAAGNHGAGDRQRQIQYLVIEQLKEARPEAFKAANPKGDDWLTLQEYVNALFIDFDKADSDKDSSLSFEEIEVYSRTTDR
jgi:hypothetical protein